MKRSHWVFALLLIWVVVQAWSFWSAAGIEGPRNIDTGFRRLDHFFRWQILALGLAVIAAIAGFLSLGGRRIIRLIGLLPICLTALAVGGLYLFVSLEGSPPVTSQPTRPKTTAPVDQ